MIFDFDFKSFCVDDFDFDFKIILRLIYDHPSNHQILQVALQAAEQQLHVYFIDLHTFTNRELWSVGLISINDNYYCSVFTR